MGRPDLVVTAVSDGEETRIMIGMRGWAMRTKLLKVMEQLGNDVRYSPGVGGGTWVYGETTGGVLTRAEGVGGMASPRSSEYENEVENENEAQVSGVSEVSEEEDPLGHAALPFDSEM